MIIDKIQKDYLKLKRLINYTALAFLIFGFFSLLALSYKYLVLNESLVGCFFGCVSQSFSRMMFTELLFFAILMLALIPFYLYYFFGKKTFARNLNNYFSENPKKLRTISYLNNSIIFLYIINWILISILFIYNVFGLIVADEWFFLPIIEGMFILSTFIVPFLYIIYIGYSLQVFLIAVGLILLYLVYSKSK